MKVKVKTFQEEHKKFFIASMLWGFYPPGIDQLIESKLILKVFWALTYVPTTMCWIYVLGCAYALTFVPGKSSLATIQIIRRGVVLLYAGAQLAGYTYQFPKIDRLLRTWNNDINKDYGTELRKNILKDKMKGMKSVLGPCIFIRVGMAQLYNIPLMLHRYMRSSEYAGLPHDNASPYHFYYVAFQVANFSWSTIAYASLEIILVYMLTMAETEIEFLKQKLVEVVSRITFTEVNTVLVKQSYPEGAVEEATLGDDTYKKGVELMEKDLMRWLKAQQTANQWMAELKDYMIFIISVKYLYLAVHCSLVVIGFIGAGSQNMINDAFLTLAIAIGNFGICFYVTRQCDRLHENSGALFLDTYAKGWYMYPVRIQRILGLIATFTTTQPIVFTGLKIWNDNSENFSGVLQTAYQVLTFILPTL